MQAKAGSYILILKNSNKQILSVGRLGELCFKPGYYCYTGSARGPGGVKSRLGRHLAGAKTLRWHIDYLRQVTRVYNALYCYNTSSLEHLFAKALAEMGYRCAFPGFGSSDCSCPGHLWFLPSVPVLKDICAQFPHIHFESIHR